MSKTTSSIDSNLVRTLAELLDETKLTEIEYEAQGLRIRVARSASTQAVAVAAPAVAPVAASAAAPAAAAAVDLAHHPGAVTSPMVGVVYTAPEPGAPDFVKVGDKVSAGQTLMLIEAMKTFNPIRTSRSGTVTRILVSNGAPVEFGEPLLLIE